MQKNWRSEAVGQGKQLQGTGIIALLLSFLTFALSGCAVHRVKVDYVGFEKAYADTSNHELLLNLARLQNHDPTYFFKLGQITSSYRMQAALTGAGNYLTQNIPAGQGNANGGGTPGVLFEHDPQFQFIPVNDETNAQLLLKPIPAETFYILYQQGWRFDQLLRLMADRIEVTHSTPTSCDVTTYRNVPPPATMQNGALVLSGNPVDLGTYVSFLRISAVMYGLQRRGHLLLRGVSRFVPLDREAGPMVDEGGKQFVTADAVEKAAEKQGTWEKSADGRWMIGHRVTRPRFYLAPPRRDATGPYEPDTRVIAEDLLADPALAQLRSGSALPLVLTALHSGLSIEADSGQPEETEIPCPYGPESYSSHLVLRSLIGVMAGASQEQMPFEALERGDPVLPVLPGDTVAVRFTEAVPTLERLPILRLRWRESTGGQPTTPLTEVSYRGATYLVADSQQPVTPENTYWNRDMFRLINALTSQVTVDISKFPIPDVLNLRAQ